MKLRTWEGAAALVGALFGLLFLFSNVWGIGLGLLCADALWLLTRVQIVERPAAPGRYARLRGRLGVVKLLLIGGVYAAVVYSTTVVQSDGKGTRLGLVAGFALAGLAFMLLGEASRSANEAGNWLIGARAEKRVGQELDRLKEQGWAVVHGYKRDVGGDIDHALAGPGGVFVVETKSHSFRRRDLRQVAWNAAWLKERLGVQWVTGILCVRTEDPPKYVDDKFWVVGYDDVAALIAGQHAPPLAPQRLHEALTSGERRGLARRAVDALRKSPGS